MRVKLVISHGFELINCRTLVYVNKIGRLNIPYIRLETQKPADAAILRALTTQRDMRAKLNISYGFELTNFKISVYFNNIGLIQQLIERLMTPFQEL